VRIDPDFVQIKAQYIVYVLVNCFCVNSLMPSKAYHDVCSD